MKNSKSFDIYTRQLKMCFFKEDIPLASNHSCTERSLDIVCVCVCVCVCVEGEELEGIGRY